MNIDNFQWNTETLFELIKFSIEASSKKDLVWTSEILEQFKASKQPPLGGWEVVSHRNIQDGTIEKYTYALLYNPNYEIYSVRRRSDQCILEVSKEYEIELKNKLPLKGKIALIQKWGDELYYFYFKGSEHSYPLSFIETVVECKPVWFTTEDGIGIREGYYYYAVDNNYKPILNKATSPLCGQSKSAKYFSAIEAAEKYCAENKPYLSIAMIREALELARGKNAAAVIINDIQVALLHINKGKNV